MAKLNWQPNSARKQDLEFKVGFTDFEADETYLGLSESDFSDDPFQRYYASRIDNFKGDHWRSYLKHSIEINDNNDLVSMAYCNKFHRNWYKLNDIKDVNGLPAGAISMSEAIGSGGPALATLKGENAGTWRVRANNRDYYLWGLQTALDSRFEQGHITHTLESGLRYHTDHVKRYQWQDEVNVDNSGTVLDTSYGTKGGAGNRTQTARATALYVQDTISMGPLDLVPGVRGEHIENEFNDRTKTAGKQTDVQNVYAMGIGSRYTLSGEMILFAGLYRGYSVPSPSDSITKGLDPETSTSGELGTRYQKDALGVQGSCFYTDLNNLIVGGYVGGPSDTDAENAGDIISYGLELKIESDIGKAHDLGFKCPVWVAYTYTDATLDGDTVSKDPSSIFSGGEDGNKVPYIPDNQISIGVGLGLERLSCELSAKYIDETYSTANNSSEQLNPVTGNPDARFGKIDSRIVVNASGRYQITDDVAFFANIYNLFDEEYLASRHPHGPRPGQPQVAMAGIEATF